MNSFASRDVRPVSLLIPVRGCSETGIELPEPERSCRVSLVVAILLILGINNLLCCSKILPLACSLGNFATPAYGIGAFAA